MDRALCSQLPVKLRSATRPENLDCCTPRGDELNQRAQSVSVLPEQIDEEKIEQADLYPKVPNRPTNQQKEKEQQHARIGHEQSPPSEEWPGKLAISIPQPKRNFLRKRALGHLMQTLQAGREKLLLRCKIQIEREQNFLPRLIGPTQTLEFASQLSG